MRVMNKIGCEGMEKGEKLVSLDPGGIVKNKWKGWINRHFSY